MIHWMRKRIISILLIFVLILPYVVIATGTTTDDINNAQNKKNDLQKQIDAENAQIAQIAKDSKDILSYIKSMDQEMVKVDATISDLNTQIANKQVQINDNEALLTKTKIDLAEQYASMKLRIQYMYEHESTSYLEIMLAAKDMGDLLNKAEYINKITDYDRAALVKYVNTEKAIQDTQVTLETQKIELDDSMASVQVQKDALQLVLNAKDTELKRLNDLEAKANASVTQNKKAIDAQNAVIATVEAEIKRQEEAARASGGVMQTYDGGKFTWPVPASHRITSPWGDMVDRSAPHNGVDIGAAKAGSIGDQIVAAYDGVVTISAYSDSAGNWIWINHGNGLYTVYMHASKLLVSVGTHVTKGQVIALMGNTGYSYGSHLHFGVRVDGKQVDPNIYINYRQYM